MAAAALQWQALRFFFNIIVGIMHAFLALIVDTSIAIFFMVLLVDDF